MKRLAIFLSFFGLLTFYTGAKVSTMISGHGFLGWELALLVCAFILGWQFAYRAGVISEESRWSAPLAWSSTMIMGFWATFVFLCLANDIGRILVTVGVWLTGKTLSPF